MKTIFNFKSGNTLPPHGSPQDRGSADAWYQRDYEPHWWPEGTGHGIKVIAADMTEDQIAEYKEGFDRQEALGDRKDWG